MRYKVQYILKLQLCKKLHPVMQIIVTNTYVWSVVKKEKLYHITFFPIRVQLNLLKRLNWCFSFHLWSLINISENLHVIGYLKIWQTAVCSKCCVHRGPFGPFNHTPHPKRRQELWHCKEKNLIGDNFFPTWGHSGEGWLWNPQCFSGI